MSGKASQLVAATSLQKSNLSPSTIAGVCVGAIMHVPVPIDENGTLLLRQVQTILINAVKTTSVPSKARLRRYGLTK